MESKTETESTIKENLLDPTQIQEKEEDERTEEDLEIAARLHAKGIFAGEKRDLCFTCGNIVQEGHTCS